MSVTIRPDMRTSSGEVSDILLKDRFVGTLTLVYREGERLSGAIQLDKGTLKQKQKNEVLPFVENYIQALVNALEVSECDVIVTYSKYDQVIIAEDEDIFELGSLEEEAEENQLANSERYELVIVGESRNKVEYHVYGEGEKWIAEAFITIRGNDVIGEVNWSFEPTEDEIEAVTDLIVSDFDENEVDTFSIDVKYKGELIDIEQLAHEDVIMDSDLDIEETDDYSVVLARDDADTLTYEVYKQTDGGIPIATATIDISQRKLLGNIHFEHPEDEENREHIASLLMNELDKEKDYESFNLTMMHNNQLIDEILFETDQLH